MLSFFGIKPRCPISLEERVWIERRMRWLTLRLGNERLQAATPSFPDAVDFPEIANLNFETARPLFDRLARVMGVRQSVQLEVISDDLMQQSAEGLYQSIDGVGVITIRESTLTDPLRTLAVMAHELSHAILLGEGHLDGSESDMEMLTDLTTIFCGCGVFGANACLRETYEQGVLYFQWNAERLGYMNSQQFGYGLAVYCWLRADSGEEWRSQLRLDARETMMRGLKFLNHRHSQRIVSRPEYHSSEPDTLFEVLASRDEALQLDALWELSENFVPIPDRWLPMFRDMLRHREACIVVRCLEVLLTRPEVAELLEPEVLNCLWYESIKVRIAALSVVAVIPRTSDVLQSLVDILAKQRDHSVRISAANLLLGHTSTLNATKLVPELLKGIRMALLNQQRAVVVGLLQVMDELTDESQEIVRARFEASEEDEWLVIVLDCLEEARQKNGSVDKVSEE